MHSTCVQSSPPIRVQARSHKPQPAQHVLFTCPCPSSQALPNSPEPVIRVQLRQPVSPYPSQLLSSPNPCNQCVAQPMFAYPNSNPPHFQPRPCPHLLSSASSLAHMRLAAYPSSASLSSPHQPVSVYPSSSSPHPAAQPDSTAQQCVNPTVSP